MVAHMRVDFALCTLFVQFNKFRHIIKHHHVYHACACNPVVVAPTIRSTPAYTPSDSGLLGPDNMHGHTADTCRNSVDKATRSCKTLHRIRHPIDKPRPEWPQPRLRAYKTNNKPCNKAFPARILHLSRLEAMHKPSTNPCDNPCTNPHTNSCGAKL